MKQKVTVVGAGNVGATAAQRIVEKELADVALIDILAGVPQGKALDMMESAPVERFDAKIVGSNDYGASAGSDVVVITAGSAAQAGDEPRRPRGDQRGHRRRRRRARSCRASPEAILIVVSNPLDAMCEVARRVSGLPRERVFGMAGVLDSARMRWFMAEALGVSVENTHAFVLGGHGDTMVPLPRFSTVAGIPLPELLPKEKIDAIVQRTRDGGAEIVNLLKTSAWYAPASAAVEMVDAVLKDKKKILPCAAYLKGEYGMSDVYLGVPVKLGSRGVEQIVEIALTAEEKAARRKSADGGARALPHPQGLGVGVRARRTVERSWFRRLHSIAGVVPLAAFPRVPPVRSTPGAAQGAEAYNATVAPAPAAPPAGRWSRSRASWCRSRFTPSAACS